MTRLATSDLRVERARIRVTLAQISEAAGSVAAAPLAERGRAMREVVDALDACLGPHLEWEERTLHPIVDKFACEGPASFSASMRYEHEIIHRWMAELARTAAAPGDAVGFLRQADRLLGVVTAHFELEEHVFFPVLDRSISAEWLRDRAGSPPACGTAQDGSP